MDKLDYKYLEEVIKFFENEIKQYKIAMSGIIREEYRKYLVDKIKYYQVAMMAIKEFLQNEEEVK